MLLIFVKESTFVSVVKPRNGWFGHKNGSKYGFLPKFDQKPIWPYFETVFWQNHLFLGLAIFTKFRFFDKNEPFSFYNV